MRKYDYKKHKGRSIFGKSLTIPDQSYGIRDLLRRFRNGTMPPVGVSGSFDDSSIDDPLPDFAAMDLTELAEYQQKINNRINTLKKQYDEYTTGKSQQGDTNNNLNPAGNTSVPEEKQVPGGSPQ